METTRTTGGSKQAANGFGQPIGACKVISIFSTRMQAAAPDPEYWMAPYPTWLDPNPAEGTCVACGKKSHVQHHVYSRQLRPEVVPMCRPCESAVHGRTQPKPRTSQRVLDLRRMLPTWATTDDYLAKLPGKLEQRLVKNGDLKPLPVRLGGTAA